MAKWNVSITEDRIVKTLFFMERVFEEVWEEDTDGRWKSKTTIDQEVAAAFPIMDTEISNIIEELTAYDEDEVVEALAALTEHERRVRLENADMDDCYLYGFGVSQEPDGEEQLEGEYCNQYQRGEDSFDGTYYWQIEDSTQYAWVNYSI